MKTSKPVLDYIQDLIDLGLESAQYGESEMALYCKHEAQRQIMLVEHLESCLACSE